MKVNYHTHTIRCHHAVGKDREYIEQAIKSGFEILGFSEHSPYYFPGDYYSGHRLRPEEVDEYIDSLTSLAEEYKNYIKIYIGYEAEYYPKYFNKALDIMKKRPFDYLILGQHFSGNEIGEKASIWKTEDADDLQGYVDQCIEAMKTGAFFYIAHPDIKNYIGDLDIYREKMTQLCVAAKELNVPLEFNLYGFMDHRNYPYDEFFKLASKVGNDVIFGVDAHNPARLGCTDEFENALRKAEQLKLNIIEPREPIFFNRGL